MHACKCSHAAADGGIGPRANAALPLWTAIDNIRRRYLNIFSSPVIIIIYYLCDN